MSETDTPDDNQISDDDWAAAMQEQAAAEGLTDSAESALGGESPFQAKPASPSSSTTEPWASCSRLRIAILVRPSSTVSWTGMSRIMS